MTVEQLITHLSKYRGDLEVWVKEKDTGILKGSSLEQTLVVFVDGSLNDNKYKKFIIHRIVLSG